LLDGLGGKGGVRGLRLRRRRIQGGERNLRYVSHCPKGDLLLVDLMAVDVFGDNCERRFLQYMLYSILRLFVSFRSRGKHIRTIQSRQRIGYYRSGGRDVVDEKYLSTSSLRKIVKQEYAYRNLYSTFIRFLVREGE
jgi:hypothetical protein